MVKTEVDVSGNPIPCSLYFDQTYKDNLDALKKKQEKNWDVVGCFVGYEGDGKTTHALQTALYLDSNLNLDNVVFNDKQFLELINSPDLKKGTCIVWDESDAVSGHHASTIVQVLIQTFKRIRKKNCFILLVTPSFFDFNKYFAIHRLMFLVNDYAKGLERGFFGFYNRDTKRQLYMCGKKMWYMGVVKPNFIGRFTDLPKGFPLDMEAYEKKKDLATEKLKEDTITNSRTGYKRVIRERMMFVANLDKFFKEHNLNYVDVKLLSKLSLFSTSVCFDAIKNRHEYEKDYHVTEDGYLTRRLKY